MSEREREGERERERADRQRQRQSLVCHLLIQPGFESRPGDELCTCNIVLFLSKVFFFFRFDRKNYFFTSIFCCRRSFSTQWMPRSCPSGLKVQH